jgi:hypothetical protein
MMLSFLKKLFRRPLPPGEQWVDETDWRKLYIEMQKWCPDCRHRSPRYFEGPSGGISTNIFCGDCGAGFNITPVLEIAERIGKNEHYIISEKGRWANDG